MSRASSAAQRNTVETRIVREDDSYRLLVESLADHALFLVDPNGLVASWNAGAQRVYGFRAEEIIGHPVGRLLLREETECGWPSRLLAGATSEGRVEDQGWRVRKDGSRFWADVVITALRQPDGQMAGFTHLTRDISHRREAELRLRWSYDELEKRIAERTDRLAAANARLRNEVLERQRAEEEVRLLQTISLAVNNSPDLESALSTALEHICRFTKWECGEAWIPDETSGRLRQAAAWSQPDTDYGALMAEGQSLAFAPAEGLQGRAWLAKGPVWVSDIVHEWDLVRAATALGLGLRTAAAIPVLSNGMVVAVLGFFMTQPRKDDERLMGLVTSIASQLGSFVDRKRIEEALRSSEEKYRSIVETTHEWIWSMDVRGRLTFSNGAAEKILGYSAPELVGRSSLELMHEEDRATALDLQRKLADGIKPGWSGLIFRWRHKDGSFRYLESTAVPLLDGHGTVVGFRGADRDVTARIQAEEALQLSARMASVGTLAAGVAHEINNPLAYVIANLNFIAEELTDVAADLPGDRLEELLQVTAEAREGADRVQRIVRDLKSFSRVDDEQLGPVDVGRAMEWSINMGWNEIRHRARVVKDYAQVPPVMANESRLGQVFLNLLVNAAQAIPEGRVDQNEIRIRCWVRPEGQVVTEIRDTGCGIRPEVLSRIFDPFFTTKPVGVGTGLGLSVCHGIVTKLGGKIEVESELGKGTAFRVVLPATADAASSPKITATDPRQRTRRGRLLIVDDEPMVGAAVRRILASEHEVLALTSAVDAVRRLTEGERFDVILCDLMMPEMSGMDFHAEVQKSHPDQAQRIIFMTGGAFTPRAQTFLAQVPGQGYLEKPFDPTALRALIRKHLPETA